MERDFLSKTSPMFYYALIKNFLQASGNSGVNSVAPYSILHLYQSYLGG
jgi:hypothetical protein